jgi:hypothetical protein
MFEVKKFGLNSIFGDYSNINNIKSLNKIYFLINNFNFVYFDGAHLI